MTLVPRDRRYYVYIMTGQSWTLYIGVTNSLWRRIFQHKTGACEGFTKRYHLKWLVYFEVFRNVQAAIAREKELKGWTRARKKTLIESANPDWKDLSKDWYPPEWLAGDVHFSKQPLL